MIAAADAARQPAVLSGGLSRGLCLINKAVASARSGGKRSALPRMLCLQGSPDATQQYIAVMNSIFAAQVEIGCPHPCSPYKALSMWHCLRLHLIPLAQPQDGICHPDAALVCMAKVSDTESSLGTTYRRIHHHFQSRQCMMAVVTHDM